MTVRKPILVTGSHRSGTTWVGKMISACPSVGYIHEPLNFEYSGKFCGRSGVKIDFWYPYITEENEEHFYSDIKNSIDLNYNLLKQIKVNTTLSEQARTIKEYLQFSRARFGKFTPLIKDPLALFSSEWLASKFDTKVVILIRHPAAFASSLNKLGWNFDFSHFLHQPLLIRDYLHPFHQEIINFSNQDRDIIDQSILLWNIIYATVSQYKVKHPDWIYLRYEDIAINPLSEFEKLFDRLELNFSQSVKSRIERYSNQSNPVDSSKAYLTKRNSRENIIIHKRRLTSQQIERIKNGVAKVSSEFYSEEDW